MRRAIAAAAIVAAFCGSVWARPAATLPLAPPAVLTLDTAHPGTPFRAGAVGLSTEARELSTGHLSAAHGRLVRLMRMLGPALLRIGGNSVDVSWWTSSGERAPVWAKSTVTPAALTALHGLLSATGWRVLLGVDFGHFDPARAGDEARYAQQILGTALAGVEIGNEPNDYGHPNGTKGALRSSAYGVPGYLREATAYKAAIEAAAPGVPIYGPAFSQTPWLTQMGASASIYAGITLHHYPTGDCPSSLPSAAGEPPPTVGGMLSPAVRQGEDETLQALAQAGAAAARPTLIGETNNVSCSVGATANPLFASALWALDWSLRAVHSGVSSVNFHGQLGACATHNESSICAPGETAALAGDVTAQPEFYGLLAARQLEGGRFVATHLRAPAAPPEISTWATEAHDGTLKIAIDDMATAGDYQPVTISAPGYASGVANVLSSPSAYAKGGITLGRGPVTNGALWRPIPARLSRRGHTFRIVLRPASAAILTLHLDGRSHRRRA